MKKAYNKDVWRAIRNGKKRFFSIMLITALGVTMLSGLRAACQDLRYTADLFYDESGLYDISVVSTLGLTPDDIEALEQFAGVEKAEGTYSEIVRVLADASEPTSNTANKRAEIKVLTQKEINLPYLQEGTLPQNTDEIAVTQNYLTDTGKAIGDTLVIQETTEEETEPNFLIDEYRITGVVIDAADVNSQEGTVAFRASKNADYTFFVSPQAIESEIYTAVYVSLTKGKELLCYAPEYEQLIQDTITTLNAQVKPVRQQARYDQLRSEAQEELDEAKAELEEELADAKVQLADAREELSEGKSKLNAAKDELAQSRQLLEQYGMPITPELEAAETELAQQEQTLSEAEEELTAQEADFAQKEQEAWEEINEAQSEIDEIEMATWYIQDRSSLSGYSNVATDADCIESVGTAFPIIFFVIAILISLTTITRMVEEERGLIGTYKALGFTDKEIRKKYLIYAASACLLGGILGDFCGFLVLPKIIFVIFQVMYQLPQYHYQFDLLYGLGGVLLFAIGIIGAAWVACEAVLRHTPASLMRPKSPKSGSRVFLERVTPIWSRLSFLNKVTARNLFRYKKRMLMTIGGIMGCTALVLCGFVIKDSVTELMPGQYERIYRYDMLAVSSDGEQDSLLRYIKEANEVSDYMQLRIESVKIKNSNGQEQTVQLFVIDKESALADYIHLEESVGSATAALSQQGIIVTQNAANILDFEITQQVSIQNLELVQQDFTVDTLVKNYMGNAVYMTAQLYESHFAAYEPNAVLVHLSCTAEEQKAFAKDLAAKDGILQTSSVQSLKEEFSIAFSLINMVVYIIIVMAAGLALVVLFTLVSTNISERVRELATIKVLGFYDKEVHLYVNKETLILTGIGIVLGLPLGRVLGGMLTNALNMPAIYFEVAIHPASYVTAAVISFAFAIVVDVLTDRTLDHIDPVEALKSVE